MCKLVLLIVSAFGIFLHHMPATAGSSAGVGASPVIVIGFVGGYVSGDNMVHSEVQLAAKLRSMYPTGVYAEAFGNHNGKQAYSEIARLLDTNHDGTVTDDEKHAARIILYGHSWGGSEALTLARKLQKSGIPVLLTIQVDSVEKRHENDALVPANVAEAANFYQLHGFLRGRPRIRAADPERTRILGNFRFDYSKTPVNCESGYPWWDRFVVRSHTEIECDPAVWGQVESLIQSVVQPIASAAAQPPRALPPHIAASRPANPESESAEP
jgi:pimeloyl-ACP methyl ester carboxylesterase